MNNELAITVTGTQPFMGKEIPIVLGGFGPNARCVCDKTVAEIHGMNAFDVRRRIGDNITRFRENVDYIDLAQRMREAQTLELLTALGYAKQSITQAAHIYILSERGYAKLQAGVKPEFQAMALSSFYAVDGVDLPRIVLQGTKVTYDKSTIAEKPGVYSAASGGKKPHAQAIGLIISQLDIAPEEQEATPYCRNGHDGVDVQYTDSVVEKVRGWLEDHDWPKPICVDGKKCGVVYRDKEQDDS